MPNQEFIRRFREAASNERLDMYRQRGVVGADENLLVHYAWNIVLSESLYPVLQCMEIALRNSVHNSATAAFNSSYWFDTSKLLDTRSASGIDDARRRLASDGKTITAGGIVAEQSFGFWTSLFSRRLEQKLWNKICRSAFPGLPKHNRKRTVVAGHLNEVRRLRNRVFHHEPIWYINNLRDKHFKILELVEWISPAMAEFIRAIDRFPALYDSGMSVFKTNLEANFTRVVSPES